MEDVAAFEFPQSQAGQRPAATLQLPAQKEDSLSDTRAEVLVQGQGVPQTGQARREGDGDLAAAEMIMFLGTDERQEFFEAQASSEPDP